MSRITKSILISIAVLAAFFGTAEGAGRGDKLPTLLFFESPGCHECETLKNKLEALLNGGLDHKIQVQYLDISAIENYERLISLRESAGANNPFSFPILYLKGNFFEGASGLSGFIESSLKAAPMSGNMEKGINLPDYFKRFGPLAVATAGLIDGINPCAFTAIIFFISFLFFQGYEKKKIFWSGAAFMAATFITYVMIGAGLFMSLNRIAGYSAVAALINICIGALSVCLGALSLYDARLYARTGLKEGMIMQLPGYFKNKIRAMIGDRFRERPAAKRSVFWIVYSALALGFLVSITEAVCTGQVYLPTVVFVLRASGKTAMAIQYLLLYNLMFMLPLMAIFLCAAAGVKSGAFAKLANKHMVMIKISLAMVFFAFGIFIIFSYMPWPTGIAHAAETGVAEKDKRFYWDFGEAREGDVLEHTFLIQNDSTRPVNIKQINTSCACTTSDISDSVIRPWTEITIKVVFNTKGYLGEKHRYVYVHTDDPLNAIKVFEIRAAIIPSDNSLIKGEIWVNT